MTDHYDYYNFEGEPITREEWAELWAGERHVALTHVGEVDVSTVWLGLNHSILGEGPPLIFETMVFRGKLNGKAMRYPTWGAAIAGHDQMVARVRDMEAGCKAAG